MLSYRQKAGFVNRELSNSLPPPLFWRNLTEMGFFQMANTAFLCSGQGAQYPGMGKEFYENFPQARQVYECGGDILGFDLAKVSFEGTEEELGRTAVSQPAIFACSMAAWEAARQLCDPAAVAGHSLGEYAALTIAGAWTLEDGFRLIGARAAAMQQAADQNPGAMFAILGSDEGTVGQVCEQTPGYVLPVNFNSPAQTVIAGELEPAQAAAATLAEMGFKAVRLAVSSGFHSQLMASASQQFAQATASIPMAEPKLPFYCNLTGGRMAPGTDLHAYLAQHIVSPVRFHQEVAAMLEAGVDTFVELGPNKVLTTLVKRNFKQAKAYNVENLKTLEKWKATLA